MYVIKSFVVYINKFNKIERYWMFFFYLKKFIIFLVILDCGWGKLLLENN